MGEVTQGAPAKSRTAAYLLWFFFGGLGAHKFYLRRPLAGALYALCWLGMWALVFAKTPLAGFVLAALLGIALLVDLFTIPRQVRAANGVSAADIAAPGARRPMFAPKEDEPFDAARADAMIARYLNERAKPQPAPAARPVFGRR